MRLDTHRQCPVLNELYDQMWLYYNFFQPVLRQVEKEVTYDDHHVPHLHRRHDRARTPLARLLESQVLDESQRQQLLQARRSVNPRALHRDIMSKLDRLCSIAG